MLLFIWIQIFKPIFNFIVSTMVASFLNMGYFLKDLNPMNITLILKKVAYILQAT